MAVLVNGTAIIDLIDEYENMGITGAYNGPGYLSRTFYQHPSNRTVAAVATDPGTGYSANCVIYDDGSAQCWGPSDETGSSFICTSGAYDQFGNPTGCTDDNYVAQPVWIEFPAGLHIELGELDDDGDGVVNMIDNCPSGSTGWTSNSSSDYDSDGYQDSSEDTDDDGDGYEDSVDSHPTNALFHHTLTMNDGWIVGGRYENVSASYGSSSYDMITESQSSSFRAQSNDMGYRITVDGQLASNDGSSVSVNWDTTDQIIAITPTRYAGAMCVILESGALRCWAGNYQGQVGAGTTVSYYDGPSESANVSFPVPFAPKHIITGWYTSCAVLENGEAYCWGYNTGTSSLGVGFRCDSSSWANGCDGNGHIREPTLPVILPAGSSAESVYIGQGYGSPTCVVLTDGNVYCMGHNNYGQLGNGNTNSVYANENPEQVYLPPGISAEIQTMAIAPDSTCALWDNGSVYCWGQNHRGQLGDGTVCEGGNYENNCNGNTAKPIIYDPVIFPSGESAIALWLENREESYAGFCSLLTSGGIWCWGELVTNETGYHTGTGEYQSIFSIGDFIQPGNRDWDSDGIYNTNDNCAAGIQG
ncbi:MAG: thrombospondin type 3 repeat-containing protein, partial [Opitutales bacterium]